MTNEILEEYRKFPDFMELGRVTSVHKSMYLIVANDLPYKGKVSGRFEYMAYQKSDYPVVGDYVIFKPSEYDNTAVIEKVCKRFSSVQRVDAGQIEEKQILAANIDLIFICLSLNEDFNITKLQNLFSITYGSNAETIVLLTKSDLCDSIDDYARQVNDIYKDSKILTVSAYTGDGLSMIEETIGDSTAVFIGSSGVGKSTIINKILGYEYLKTLDIRMSDAQGKHATTHREMVKIPKGGYIIDTPGIRVINSYIVDSVIDEFEEISKLSKNCMYNDCTHMHEPNCKVQEALSSGELSKELFDSYLRILRLNEHNKRREICRTRTQNKRKRR